MGKTSAAVKNKYRDKVYDQINIVVRKGRKAAIKRVAKAQGESLNGFVVAAIDERVERLDGSQAKPDTWDEFDRLVDAADEKPSFEDFPRMDFGRALISFEV